MEPIGIELIWDGTDLKNIILEIPDVDSSCRREAAPARSSPGFMVTG